MSQELSRPARAHGRPPRRNRSRAWSALVAVLTAVLVSALPGTASATTVTPTITPILDCYASNSDGSMTVILGYQSTYSTTKTIAQGTNNYTNPASYGPQMPTVFNPGTHHGVLHVRVAPADLYGNPYWYLDGTTLDYRATAYTSGICSPSQLPAFANGAALVVGLLVAGAIGVLVVRRVRRSVLPTTATAGPAPVDAEPSAAGGDRA
jgi:hypothetical protein